MVRRQAVVLHDETWREDVDGLVRALRQELEPSRVPRHRLLVISAVTVTVLAASAIGLWRLSARGGDDDDAGSDPPPCTPASGTGWQPVPISAAPAGTIEVEGGGSLSFAVRDASARRDGSQQWLVLLDTSMQNDTSTDRYHGHWYYESLVVGQRAFALSCFSPEADIVIPATKGLALVGFRVECEPTGFVELVLEGARIGITGAQDPSPC
jgi:hypothetical protein